ncbi:unnamed protein product [Adineta ricciae]|uniref:Uncharacterized protein n=1 Tax=Adineta ricciae TaxID=249248 RepID=A0A815YCF2_ADIRI|nr:unnamed protein product [Adineta ricciae]CAF1568303.1 unnamed protein product [Adineta ricciae]
MTTKTATTLSPIKRCHGSPNLKKRRLSSIATHRKQQMDLSLTVSTMLSSPKTITITCEKHFVSSIKLPDLVHDLFIEEQRRQTIVNIATLLRKVGDQMDERLQINNSSSSSSSLIDHVFGQRPITFTQCLSSIFRFFL